MASSANAIRNISFFRRFQLNNISFMQKNIVHERYQAFSSMYKEKPRLYTLHCYYIFTQHLVTLRKTIHGKVEITIRLM